MKHYLTEGGKKQVIDLIKKEKDRKLLVSLLTSIALTSKAIDKVTGALVTINIRRTVIIIWNYVLKFQHRDFLSLYTEEHHPALVLVSIIVSSGLYCIGQSEGELLNVSTQFISFYQNQLQTQH